MTITIGAVAAARAETVVPYGARKGRAGRAHAGPVGHPSCPCR